ncbi:MAG: mechanosensitive ion channel family protein [Vulcanimicrobiota bacterium]
MRRFFPLFLLLFLMFSPGLAQDERDYRLLPYFEVETLNQGLPGFDQAATRELSTPDRALGYFLTQARSGNFEAAARVLDLNELAGDEQASVGPELAHKLYTVMDRKTGFPFDQIPDRVDGQLPPGPDQRVGEPRKAFLLGSFPLEIGDFEIHLNRYRTPRYDSVWLFSPGTVAKIDEAFREYGPSPWESYLPDVLRMRPIGTTPVWAWLTLVAALGLSSLISRWIAHFVGRRLEHALFKRVRPGLIWMAVSWISYVSLWPWVPVPALARYTLLLVGFVAMVWLVSTVLDYYSEKIVRGDIESVKDLDDISKQDQKKQLTSLSIGRRLLSGLVFAVGIGVVAANIPEFRTFGVSLLASAGVLSVLLGIAAQPILGNLLSGIQLAVSRPIRVGDAIDFDGIWCYVEEITYMYILCCTWDEKRLVIPLRHFITQPFSSYSLRDPETVRVIEMELDYLVDVEALREEFLRLNQAHQLASKSFKPRIEVLAFHERSVTIRAMVAARNASDSWELHCDIREGLLGYIRSQQRQALPQVRLSSRPEQAPHGNGRHASSRLTSS